MSLTAFLSGFPLPPRPLLYKWVVSAVINVPPSKNPKEATEKEISVDPPWDLKPLSTCLWSVLAYPSSHQPLKQSYEIVSMTSLL